MTRYYDVTLSRNGRTQRLIESGTTADSARTWAQVRAWLADGHWWTVESATPMHGADTLWTSALMGAGGVL